MKAFVIAKPGQAKVQSVPDPIVTADGLLLKVRMVGLCGSDLNAFRGRNPLVSFPRIPGHEVSATIIAGNVNEFYRVRGRNQRYPVSLHQLRNLCFLPSPPPQCMPIQ